MVSNVYLDKTLRDIEGWRGVYPADNVPSKIFTRSPRPQFTIINTNPINVPGGHWLLLSRYNSRDGIVLELFDSLAYPISVLDDRIKKVFIQETYALFKTNVKIIQHVNSRYCGIFAIARILSILKDQSLLSHLKIYSEKLEDNSRICYLYIRSSVTLG